MTILARNDGSGFPPGPSDGSGFCRDDEGLECYCTAKVCANSGGGMLAEIGDICRIGQSPVMELWFQYNLLDI